MTSEDLGSRPGPGWAAWFLPALALLFYLVTFEGYGVFRDELYYVACGRHLGWGYVDHPPFVALVAAIVDGLFGPSLFFLRLPVALALAATVAVAGALARELGGGRFAVLFGQFLVFSAPIYLAMSSYLSMNAFDILFWTLGAWLVARLCRTGDRRLWLAFGLLAGLALQNKLSFLFFGAGIVAALLLARRFDVLKSRELWLGGLVAGLIFAPHVLWQIQNDFPTAEFMDNARRYKNAALSPLSFILSHLFEHAGPVGGLFALGGTAALVAGRRLKAFRALGWAYPLIAAGLLLAGGAKAYYLAPILGLVLPAGAVAFEGLTARRRILRWSVVALTVALAGVAAPLAKPLLPVDTYVRYAAALGQKPSTGENKRLGRLPQFYADMHGWREMAEAVSGVYRALPAAERERACVFGQNYGEAGAIDFFRHEFDLPPAVSGHNHYYLWGPGTCTGEVVIVIGDDRETLATLFTTVELGAVFDCQDCMPYEDDLPVWVARGLKGGIGQLWLRVKHYD
ncbi:MAG: glycosyltransferase family 39 protein [Thermoanaerobaculia bacterium]|nr:glycosyltransferase family 39 protein [Thermoanaerobaculia bacterium]